MKAAAWDPVKLHVTHGLVPAAGTELRMPSGRRYLVLKVGGRATLHCLVLPANEPPAEVVLNWFWTPRKKKRRAFR